MAIDASTDQPADEPAAEPAVEIDDQAEPTSDGDQVQAFEAELERMQASIEAEIERMQAATEAPAVEEGDGETKERSFDEPVDGSFEPASRDDMLQPDIEEVPAADEMGYAEQPLTGVIPGDIHERSREERRKRSRLTATNVAGCLLLLVVAAIVIGFIGTVVGWATFAGSVVLLILLILYVFWLLG